KAGVKFKPQIHISGGCHPYPVVDTQGNIGGGLKPTGSDSGACKGSGHGSQIYGRGKWYNNIWASMYAWYFPKNMAGLLGDRHWWVEVIVWLDNPDLESPQILAVTPWHEGKYAKYVPPKADVMNGTSVKIASGKTFFYGYTLDVTTEPGETQDLIMWDQLTDEARKALQNEQFGGLPASISDGRFDELLKKAFPF
ncbi:Necrosis inducing protein NPP1, partial [Phytophthora megakarya]